MAVMCFSVLARFGFDSDGVFGHRSRLGPARNAEGGYGSLCSSSPCRDAGWLPAYRTSDGMLGPLFPFDLISVTLLGIDSISDWSQCAGGFFLCCFPSLAGWIPPRKVLPLAHLFPPPDIFIRRFRGSLWVLGFPCVVKRPISCSVFVLIFLSL